jgi:hypothetical protein
MPDDVARWTMKHVLRTILVHVEVGMPSTDVDLVVAATHQPGDVPATVRRCRRRTAREFNSIRPRVATLLRLNRTRTNCGGDSTTCRRR